MYKHYSLIGLTKKCRKANISNSSHTNSELDRYKQFVSLKSKAKKITNSTLKGYGHTRQVKPA